MEKRQINLNHNGKFYLYAEGKGGGYGFPTMVTSIPSCINVALDYDVHRVKQTLKNVTIRIIKSG